MYQNIKQIEDKPPKTKILKGHTSVPFPNMLWLWEGRENPKKQDEVEFPLRGKAAPPPPFSEEDFKSCFQHLYVPGSSELIFHQQNAWQEEDFVEQGVFEQIYWDITFHVLELNLWMK